MRVFSFSGDECDRLLAAVRFPGADIVPDRQKHSLIGYSGQRKQWELKLPLLSEFPDDTHVSAPGCARAMLLLVRTGDAAVAFHDGHNFVHRKMIHSYMVRKKHGKSQLTHMKTKGRSRGGGPLRLRNARRFFENIGRQVATSDMLKHSRFILFYCPEQLRNMVFDAVSFPRDDPRLRHVPLDIRKPSERELRRVYDFAQTAHLHCHAEEKHDVFSDSCRVSAPRHFLSTQKTPTLR